MRAFILSLFCLAPLAGNAAPTLEVTRITKNGGNICVLVFAKKDGFPNNAEKVAARYEIPAAQAKEGRLTIPLSDLAAGRFAIVVLHDLDGDRQMKTGLFGRPLEPVGLSNWKGRSRPTFESSLVDIAADGRLTIPLR